MTNLPGESRRLSLEKPLPLPPDVLHCHSCECRDQDYCIDKKCLCDTCMCYLLIFRVLGKTRRCEHKHRLDHHQESANPVKYGRHTAHILESWDECEDCKMKLRFNGSYHVESAECPYWFWVDQIPGTLKDHLCSEQGLKVKREVFEALERQGL